MSTLLAESSAAATGPASDSDPTAGSVWFVLGLLAGASLRPESDPRDLVAGVAAGPAAPVWDGTRRKLNCGDQLLCAFRRRVSAPAMILAAFQNSGWDGGLLPDPLPPVANLRRARRRLDTAVKNLNRRLPKGTIRFRHDSDARGVWWEACRQSPECPDA